MSLSPKEYAPRSGNPQGNVKHSSANKKFVWETLNWVKIPSDKPPRQNQFRVRGYVPTWTTSLREDNQYHIMGPRPHWALGLVHSRTPNGGEAQYLNLISSWHRTFNNLSLKLLYCPTNNLQFSLYRSKRFSSLLHVSPHCRLRVVDQEGILGNNGTITVAGVTVDRTEASELA